MNFWKYYTSVMTACILASVSLTADEQDGMSRFQQDLNENDFEAVNDFVKKKRVSGLESKISNLELGGEIHVEWQYIHEKIKGVNIRGHNGQYIFVEQEVVNDEIYQIGDRLPLSNNDFDVQFDLKLKYTYEDAWAASHVRYDNSMGVDDNGLDCDLDPQGYHGSGSVDNLNLKQAFIGYNLYECGDTLCFVELGRRGNLSKVFDSEIQFLSRLDGIFVRCQKTPENIGKIYWQAAGFVVDERVNQFAWASEIGWLNICNSNFDIRYSFIDWNKFGKNRCFTRNPIGFKFMVSQVMVGYKYDNFVCNKPLFFTGGFLMNHNPARYTYIDRGTPREPNLVKKKIGNRNLGWWAGFSIGELSDGDIGGEGDWSFNFIYAVVQAQAIPDNDVNLIGTGNALHQSFTSRGRGNTNFIGWQTNIVYGLTNNITLLALYETSQAADKSINGSHEYSRYKLEAVYAF